MIAQLTIFALVVWKAAKEKRTVCFRLVSKRQCRSVADKDHAWAKTIGLPTIDDFGIPPSHLTWTRSTSVRL